LRCIGAAWSICLKQPAAQHPARLINKHLCRSQQAILSPCLWLRALMHAVSWEAVCLCTHLLNGSSGSSCEALCLRSLLHCLAKFRTAASRSPPPAPNRELKVGGRVRRPVCQTQTRRHLSSQPAAVDHALQCWHDMEKSLSAHKANPGLLLHAPSTAVTGYSCCPCQVACSWLQYSSCCPWRTCWRTVPSSP
jgi:hypothetical protein